MSDATRFPSSPRQSATDGPRHDTTVMVMTVSAAADRLGISAGAVRKRLERGTLNGRKIDGHWRVLLRPDDATRHDEIAVLDATAAPIERDMSHDQASTGQDTSATPVVSAAAQAQLDAFRDAILRPHLERIEALAKHVGRLTAERDQAIQERDQAEQRLASDRVLLDLAAADLALRDDLGSSEVVLSEALPQAPARAPWWSPRRYEEYHGRKRVLYGTAVDLLFQLPIYLALAVLTYSGLTIGDVLDGAGSLFTWDRLGKASIIAGLIGVPLAILSIWPRLIPRRRR